MLHDGTPIILLRVFEQYRAVTSKSGWEKELERVAEVVRTADHLVETHRLAEASHADWYSCKMLLASALRKVKSLRSEEHTSELQSLMRISYAVFCLNKKKLTK